MRLAPALGFTALSVALLTYACGGTDDDTTADDNGSDNGAGGEGGDGGDGNDIISCRSDKACTPFDLVCDTSRSICVECLGESDCSGDALCQSGACVDVTPCDSSKDCASNQVCDDSVGYCVECVNDTDCGDDQVCAGSKCHETCDSSKECAANDQVCGSVGYCVDCEGNNDCSDGRFCSSNQCVTPVCTSGETSCSGDDLLTCREDGSAFDATTCAVSCEVDNDEASCSGDEPGECAGNTASPCSSIPKFTGTQTVDGDPEDFCDIPYTLLNLDNAELVGGPDGSHVSGSTIDSDSEAQIRVAWSASALHLHVHVVDPLLRTVEPNFEYNGDNVQLFIQGAAPHGGSTLLAGSTTGIEAADISSEPQQIILTPASDDAAASSRFVVPYGAVTGYSYATRHTADGYDIELEYPWPSGVAPLSAGSIVGFDIMLGVNDNSTGSVRQFEYGLHFDDAELDGCAAQTRDALWCDNGHWCTPTLAE